MTIKSLPARARRPAASRFETSEVEVIEEGGCVTLRKRVKDWAAYFDPESRGSLPERRQPPPDARDKIR